MAVSIGRHVVPVWFLTQLGDRRWQANVRLPNELEPGRHPVSVHSTGGERSGSLEIVVDEGFTAVRNIGSGR